MTSEDTMKRFVLNTGLIASYKSLFQDPDIVAKYPYMPPLFEAMQKPALRPPLAQYAQASDVLQRYLSAAFTGRISPEQAMRSAARETRNILGRYNSSQASQNRDSAQKVAVGA
jgi:multiple sugar transport system substrate-binding protein